MSKFLRWLPATAIMATIFIFSATPGDELPDYGFWDTLVKKGGHVTGYALLALAYMYGMNFDRKKEWLAWLFALLYAASDEFHQSFTPGRHPSPMDVIIFDNLGAVLAVLSAGEYLRRKQKSG
jgi:VanZ family protein